MSTSRQSTATYTHPAAFLHIEYSRVPEKSQSDALLVNRRFLWNLGTLRYMAVRDSKL